MLVAAIDTHFTRQFQEQRVPVVAAQEEWTVTAGLRLLLDFIKSHKAKTADEYVEWEQAANEYSESHHLDDA
jgi:hypothetical protein